MKHFKLPWNWKWSGEFEFDMKLADQLYKLGWSIKNHNEEKPNTLSE